METKIYEEYNDKCKIEDLAKKYISAKLGKLKLADEKAEDLWAIIDSYITDVYAGYEPEYPNENADFLGKLKEECVELINSLKSILKKNPTDNNNSWEIAEDTADKLYEEIARELLKNNFNNKSNKSVDDQNLDPELLASQDLCDDLYQIRLNQYLYSIGICDTQFVFDDDNSVVGGDTANSKLVLKEESRTEEENEKFLLEKMEDNCKLPVPPQIFFDAFNSPMASEQEKILEKLLAVDIFVSQLTAEEISDNAALAILRATYSVFSYIHELKCHVLITRLEALAMTLNSNND